MPYPTIWVLDVLYKIRKSTVEANVSLSMFLAFSVPIIYGRAQTVHPAFQSYIKETITEEAQIPVGLMVKHPN